MKLRRVPGWLLISLCAFTAQRSFAADYVGAAVCGECHSTEHGKHAESNHARALHAIRGSPAGALLLQAGHSPDNTLRYEPDGDRIAIHENSFDGMPELEWAFGAGAQGITPVGRLDRQYFEFQFSYYARARAWAPTFGHPRQVSTPLARIGILQDSKTIFRCFNCHGTGVREQPDGPDLSHMLPGVQCERCHAPGGAHVEAAKSGQPKQAVRNAIVNPGRFPRKALVEICGECHRLPLPDSGDEPELENSVNVRFAPMGLLASRCFRESKTLSCLTCHDPHENAKPRSDAAYTQKCLACHATAVRAGQHCRRSERQNCLPCHMRQASLGPYLRFTDHRIRVY